MKSTNLFFAAAFAAFLFGAVPASAGADSNPFGLFPDLIGGAQAAPHAKTQGLPIPLPTAIGKPVSIDQLVQKLEAISQSDLTGATAMAKSAGDTNALNCFEGISALIANLQAANATPLPKVHLVSSFEGIRLIAISLRPGSAFSTACAPLAEEVKTDVLTLVSQIAGGAITLSSFGL